jgi:predicted GNAT family N-acyltransferase
MRITEQSYARLKQQVAEGSRDAQYSLGRVLLGQDDSREQESGRGLHSSTFQLNLSHF